jgi:hypothetical protein
MRPSHLLTLVATLAAFTASAQEGSPSLEGVGRISIQGGLRYVANTTFYDNYYSLEGNRELERAKQSRGGPLVLGTFAYGISDLVEIGIDLFAHGERLQLTGQPRLTTAAYGAMIGLRFRSWLDIGPDGMVPFLGLLTGPMVAVAAFNDQPVRETFSQAWAGTVGATFRLTPTWGISTEFRQVFARGAVGRTDQKFGSFNAGGSWFTVGVNYTFPKDSSPSSRVPF